MVRSILLATHIGAGTVGLVLGPAAMAAAIGDRRSGGSIRAYRSAVAVLGATAAGLVALDLSQWPFLLLAGATVAAVLVAPHVRPLGSHVRLVCGSYVSLVTALLVVSWGSVLAWILPIVVGTVLVERAAASATRRPRPARTPSRSPTPSSPR